MIYDHYDFTIVVVVVVVDVCNLHSPVQSPFNHAKDVISHNCHMMILRQLVRSTANVRPEAYIIGIYNWS